MSDRQPAALRRRQPKQEATPRAAAMPKAERRAQLLGAARSLARRCGIDALTMSALAEEAGVSKPVVYEHFGNSEDVALALLDSCFEAMINEVHRRAGAASSLQEYLSIVVDCHFDAERAGDLTPQAITNGFTSSHAVGERLNARYREIRRQGYETIDDMLRQQGVGHQVAGIAGQIVFDILNSSAMAFGASADRDLARATVKAIMTGVVDAVVDNPSLPHTPQAILDEAQRLRST